MVADGPGADLGLGVAEPPPGQHLAEEERPLGRRAVVPQHVDVDEVAVRDLGDARVAGREEREHLGHHLGGQVGAAVRRRDGDPEQAGPRERLELAGRQDPLAVALRGADGELVAQVTGDVPGPRPPSAPGPGSSTTVVPSPGPPPSAAKT